MTYSRSTSDLYKSRNSRSSIITAPEIELSIFVVDTEIELASVETKSPGLEFDAA